MKKIVGIVAAISLCAIAVLGLAAASFIDVPADAYYAEAAQRMADKGILAGYGDGHYHGESNVTRAQMAVVACRLLDREEEAKALTGKTIFEDVTDAHAWATGYINYAVANKIINGDGDGTFRPNDNVKYEEAVKIIVCVLGLDEGVKIDPKDWSKEYIEAADKAGLLDKLVGKKGEAMLRSDIAVICDASVTVLEKEEAVASTTTKKPSVSKPIVGGTTETTQESVEPAETTTGDTKGENETPVVPAETTKRYWGSGENDLPAFDD